MRRDWDEALKEELIELHLLMHKLLRLQQEKKMEPIYKVGDFNFDSSTAQTAKKLKVTDSDLRVLRNTKDLREGFHYTTGRSPRPTAIWYDLNRTCLFLHEVDYATFSQPGFDVQANTNRNTAKAFERARRAAKK
jgi:hypothetical protein